MTHASCDRCSNELTPVSPLGNESYQYDNALLLGGFGGFGMFVESPEYESRTMTGNNPLSDTGATFGVVLCGSCAQEFVDEIPALKRFFDDV